MKMIDKIAHAITSAGGEISSRDLMSAMGGDNDQKLRREIQMAVQSGFDRGTVELTSEMKLRLGAGTSPIAAVLARRRRPPMTMVERVARALCTQHYEKRFAPIKGNPHAPHIMMNVEGNWHVFLEPARAAIEAMKEPNLAMRKVCGFKVAEIDYPAMIKAALEEGN